MYKFNLPGWSFEWRAYLVFFGGMLLNILKCRLLEYDLVSKRFCLDNGYGKHVWRRCLRIFVLIISTFMFFHYSVDYMICVYVYFPFERFQNILIK